MGAVSRSVHAEGGRVIGIAVRALMESGGEGEKAPEKAVDAVPEREGHETRKVRKLSRSEWLGADCFSRRLRRRQRQ